MFMILFHIQQKDFACVRFLCRDLQ